MAPIDPCLSFGYLLNESATSSIAQEVTNKKRCAPSSVPSSASKRHRTGQDQDQTGQPSSLELHLGGRFALSQTVLGTGQYGRVRECTDLATGERLACKTVTQSLDGAGLLGEDLANEVDVMTRVAGHENVMQLRGVAEDETKGEVHLVMDLCQGGELYDEVVRRESFNEADAAHLFVQIVRAVAFCHARGVVHRDLKPENILLSRPLKAGVPVADQARQGPLLKVADFGLAMRVAPGQRLAGVAGSPFYIAPEVLQGCSDFKADVWSLGVILYILLSGTPPFWGPTDGETFQSIQRDAPDLVSEPWNKVSVEAKSLLRCLLCKDPARRPAAKSILTHPWLLRHLAQRGHFLKASIPMAEAVTVPVA